MKFKEFMNMYDDWNGILKVNNDNLDYIVKDKAFVIMENRQDLYEREVVSFGFYDGELCVRVKQINLEGR